MEGDSVTFFGGLLSFIQAAALFVFFWGLSMYMYNAADRERRKEGIDIMMTGVIAMLIIVLFWGLATLF